MGLRLPSGLPVDSSSAQSDFAEQNPFLFGKHRLSIVFLCALPSIPRKQNRRIAPTGTEHPGERQTLTSAL